MITYSIDSTHYIDCLLPMTLILLMAKKRTLAIFLSLLLVYRLTDSAIPTIFIIRRRLAA